MRPFSYFCTCWEVGPSASPSFPLAHCNHAAHAHPAADVLVEGLGDFFPLSQTQKSAHFYRLRVGPKNIFSW